MAMTPSKGMLYSICKLKMYVCTRLLKMITNGKKALVLQNIKGTPHNSVFINPHNTDKYVIQHNLLWHRNINKQHRNTKIVQKKNYTTFIINIFSSLAAPFATFVNNKHSFIATSDLRQNKHLLLLSRPVLTEIGSNE